MTCSDIEKATYSVEDNKLRLYPVRRLDKEVFLRLKENGFKWAPKQELFVAPSWTPEREDFCVELAGELEPEETTMIERAQAKAERLDSLAERRGTEAGAFMAAADRISKRFEFGQPILVGHHSERKARRDQQRMHSSMDQAVKASKAVDYWAYRAEGVERHANRKAAPGVRANRIKTLLAELRGIQRSLNHAYLSHKLWSEVEAMPEDTDEQKTKKNEKIRCLAGATIETGALCSYDVSSALYHNEITEAEAIEKTLAGFEKAASAPKRFRWINHLLNRLAYERSELDEVSRYSGELTAAVIQIFAREQGAFKPKAKKTDAGWELSSLAPLPLHIGDGETLELSDDAWRDLMQECGHETQNKGPAKPPILNFKAVSVKVNIWGNVKEFPQIRITKEEYSKICSDYRGVKLSACGQFRVKVCIDPHRQRFDSPWFAVYLTDSKAHDAPESEAVTYKVKEA